MLFCYLDTQGLVRPRERKCQAHTAIIFSPQGEKCADKICYTKFITRHQDERLALTPAVFVHFSATFAPQVYHITG